MFPATQILFFAFAPIWYLGYTANTGARTRIDSIVGFNRGHDFQRDSHPVSPIIVSRARFCADEAGHLSRFLYFRIANSCHSYPSGSGNQRVHLVRMSALFPPRTDRSGNVVVRPSCLHRRISIERSRRGRDLCIRAAGCSAAVNVVVRDR